MGSHRVTTPDLDRVFRGEAVTGLSEWQLLERYLEARDELAFEVLVQRLGPMVLGVCRRALANPIDVDDAFQATFLVLVRRARHLGPRDAIGPWLHGVASRVAMRARCAAARRRRLEPTIVELTGIVDERRPDDREIGEVIDHELSRLPAKYRHPIILCYLEGQTHEEAARQLNWPVGTVKGRLARARSLLQSRLIRRGLAPSVAAMTLTLSRDSAAGPHRELLDRTLQASLKMAFGPATAQIVSASIRALVEGVLTSMFFNSLRWAGVAMVVAGLACTGLGVMARQEPALKKAEPRSAVIPATAPPASTTPEPSPMNENQLVAPSPHTDDAVANLAELRRALVKAASSEWAQALEDYKTTHKGLETAYQASKRLLTSQQGSAENDDDKLSALKAHSQRIRDLARQILNPASGIATAQIKTYAAEAELWLAQARTDSSTQESTTGPGHQEGRGSDAKSQQILAKLEEPIAMSFKEETPLADVLKYVKKATTSSTYVGIPIYVDPLGLQEAEKSMSSTVKGMNLEGVPLRRTLQLLLKQLDLVYFVEDGILCITCMNSEGRFGALGPAMSEPSPILQKAEKAERGEMSLPEMKDLIELFKTRDQIMKLSSGQREQEHVNSTGSVRNAGKTAN
jgi:RNA polymerase sigma factor (sigma-70 family)